MLTIKDFNNAIFNIYGEGTMYNHLINISNMMILNFMDGKIIKIFIDSDIILITGKL